MRKLRLRGLSVAGVHMLERVLEPTNWSLSSILLPGYLVSS